MKSKVESETPYTSYANEAQGDVQDIRAQADVTPSVADTVLPRRRSDLPHVRQPQVLQSQDDGWFVKNPSMEGHLLAEAGRNNFLPPMQSTARGKTASNRKADREDDDEYGGSDRDRVGEVKAEASEWKSQITDEEKEARASPQQRPHAAVEKRYRRTVNTKLQQLYMSIPASGKFCPDERAATGSDESDQAAKPVVLDKAIQYVQHLTETYLKYDADIEDLRRQLRDVSDHYGVSEQKMQPRAEG